MRSLFLLSLSIACASAAFGGCTSELPLPSRCEDCRAEAGGTTNQHADSGQHPKQDEVVVPGGGTDAAVETPTTKEADAADENSGEVGAATSDAAPSTDAGHHIGSPAKIVCLGDSITEAKDSWIYALQDKLRAKGCKYQLIGLDRSPYNGAYQIKPGYDNQRVAAGGFSTTGILNLIKEQGMGGVPDVVVEYLGVNNVYGGYIDGKYNPDNRNDPTGSYLRDNEELIEMVRAKNANAIFVLMKIENHLMKDIDATIDKVVMADTKMDSPVLSAPNVDGVATIDGVHPTVAGHVVLAGPVSDVVVRLLTERGLCN